MRLAKPPQRRKCGTDDFQHESSIGGAGHRDTLARVEDQIFLPRSGKDVGRLRMIKIEHRDPFPFVRRTNYDLSGSGGDG